MRMHRPLHAILDATSTTDPYPTDMHPTDQHEADQHEADQHRPMSSVSESLSAEERTTEAPSFAYQPALDGIRAVSVLLVLLFHAGLPFVRAGYLGVSVFFTLSGFLITSLLLVERARSGTIRVGAFYGRRVKRLLPASMFCVLAVVVARQFGAFAEVPDLRGDVIGAVLQVFNWVQLAGTGSYGDLFGSATSPLEHYWSLAIEEQFYWVWPLVVLLVVRRPSTKPGRRRRLTVLLGVATIGFAIVAPVVAQVWGPDAAYWATPARLAEILVGALLAAVLHGRRVPANARRLAAPALAVIVAASMVLPSDSGPAYEGWLPLFAVCSALLIFAVQADGWMRRALSWRPLVAIGAISYGLYLFHWPVFVLLRERGWDLATVPGLAVALAITFAISIVSYRVVERPVRHATWRPLPTLRLAGVASAAVLASSVLIGPGVSAIRADQGLLGAAAIEPTGEDVPLVPLAPPSTIGASGTDTATDQPTESEPITDATVDLGDTGDAGDTGDTGDTAAAAGDVPASAEADETEPVTTAPPTPTSAVVETSVELLPAPARPVRILVVGDSTALYTGQGLAEWSTTVPDHAQVSVSWCQGCTFELEGTITSFDVDGVEENSRRTMQEVMPQAIRQLRPDVVVMMATVSEVANREWSSEEGPIGPLDPRFRERMIASYSDITMEIIQMGVPDVVWVVPPTPHHLWHEPEMNEIERYAAHHEIIREAMSRFEAHVSIVDLDAWVTASGLATDNGFRADGVHIDQGPAAEMAARFLGPWLVREALTPDS